MSDVPKESAIRQVSPLGGMPWQTEDPFLFCVHHDDDYPAGNAEMGPAASLAGRDIGQDFAGLDGWRMYHGDVVPGFPSHPHRGFETVTVVRRGFIDHSDSLGAAARFGEGDVQWLTAGKGVVHSEMFPLLAPDARNPAELFQIWLNLPRARKMADPHFTMLWGETLPVLEEKDAAGKRTQLTLVAGAYAGHVPPAPPPDSWAADPASDVAIWTIALEAGATWTLPPARKGTNRALYYFAGTDLKIDGTAIPPSSRVRVEPERELVIAAGDAPASLLLLQGRPIAEPVAQYGPFVMTTAEEIHEAFADYRRTEFGGWPWPEPGPVHARDAGRFARYPDGRVDRPPAASAR